MNAVSMSRKTIEFFLTKNDEKKKKNVNKRFGRCHTNVKEYVVLIHYFIKHFVLEQSNNIHGKN